MPKRINITLSPELLQAIDALASLAGGVTRSRIIENYLQEHVLIRRKIMAIRSGEVKNCGICGVVLKLGDMKIPIDDHGLVCVKCAEPFISEALGDVPSGAPSHFKR